MSSGTLRATVTAEPEAGSRAVRVRFDGGVASAPAFVPTDAAVPSVGDRVYVELVGRRPLVRGRI